MPIDSTSPADELGALRESQNQLSTRMEQLLLQFESLTAHRPSPTTPAAATAAAAQQASTFVPPIAGVGANGASTFTPPLSLRSRFPDVKAAVIVAIITHEFKAADLHKLDPMNRDKETAYTFNGSTNQFEVSHRAAREYKNPFSILIPLTTYFKVLAFHVNNNAATDAFWDYSAHLLKLVAEYEWHAVYAYHSIFFNRRRAEMAAGDYSRWGQSENGLLAEHVYGHRKPNPSKQAKNTATTRSNPAEACRKFNDGKCLNMPCPWGRPHTCSSCGKSDHSKLQHKD
ncbi:hypothetical protein H2248_005274 [Termitomyces sp. 'cryptogamus']|nr:hypothetical protein H2248_005274 [Termitomyces sp. 'cryptogamus']